MWERARKRYSAASLCRRNARNTWMPTIGCIGSRCVANVAASNHSTLADPTGVPRRRSNVQPSPAEAQSLFNDFGFVLTEEQIARGDRGRHRHRCLHRFPARSGIRHRLSVPRRRHADCRTAGRFGLGTSPHDYGLMAFGRDPQSRPQTSNLLVQCAAYAGTDRASDTATRSTLPRLEADGSTG